MKHINLLLLAGLLLTVTLFGCNELTRENYDLIELGMDYYEVISILGEPDTCDSILNAKNCIWGDETKNITIKFVADKVLLPSMKGL